MGGLSDMDGAGMESVGLQTDLINLTTRTFDSGDVRVRVDHKRRPEVQSEFTVEEKDGWRDSSGVQLQVTRRGLYVTGYYDSFVGLQGFLVPWEEFRQEYDRVLRSGGRGRGRPPRKTSKDWPDTSHTP